MQIIYEPHPVSAKRKAELRKQGLKIIDARFAPEGFKHVLQQQAEDQTEAPSPATQTLKRRGRPKKDAE